jgi:cytochrome o ubiquinol oxidase subunit 1
MKKNGYVRPESGFIPIHMPKNTGAGFILAALSALVGFALIWHMWLIACVGFATLLIAIVVHTFNYKRDYHIPAAEVTRVEGIRTRVLAGGHV